MHTYACIVIRATRILKMPRKLSKKVSKKLAKRQKLERQFRDTRVFINVLPRLSARTHLQSRTIYSLYAMAGATSEFTVTSCAVSGQCVNCSIFHVALAREKQIFVLCQTVRLLLRVSFPELRRSPCRIDTRSSTMVFNVTLPCELSRARAARLRIALRTMLSSAIQIADNLAAADRFMCVYIAKRAACVFARSAVCVLFKACIGWLFPHSKDGRDESMLKYFPNEYQMLLN